MIRRDRPLKNIDENLACLGGGCKLYSRFLVQEKFLITSEIAYNS
jgi:hypothetical protein